MANTIKHKRSSTPSATPSTSDLELGELAVNTYDGKLFLKKDDGTASVVEIGAGGGGGGSSTLAGLTDVTITSASTDQIIKYNGSDWVNSSVIAAKNYIATSSNSFATSLTPSAGALSIDSSLGNILLGALSASVTDWDFTNITTDSNRAITITVIIDGNSSYTYGSDCSVNGSAVSGGVTWLNGSAPTATNNTDVISFTIVKDGSGVFKVFGSASETSTLSVSELSDTTITSASSGDVLSYDGSGWVNSNLPEADGSTAGIVTTGAQTLAGAKTFSSDVIATRYIQSSTNSFTTSLTPSAGALSVDSSTGNVLLGALSASVTDWDFTNVTTDSNKVTSLTVIIDGNSSYTYGSDCSVNGSAVSGGVTWFDGSAPTATDDTDVISFTIIKDGSGTFKVFGAAAGSSTLSVSQLSDTTISSASSGEVLQYDGSGWVNASPPTPTGSVIAFAGASAPSGWLLCDGTAVSRSTYADLFTIISTTYGSGDGSSTFNVPDLRRRTPYGKGTSDSLGDSDGVAEGSRSLSHTHSVPAHYHGKGTLNITSSGTHTTSISHDHASFNATGYTGYDGAHTHGINAGETGGSGSNRYVIKAVSPTYITTAGGAQIIQTSATHRHSITLGVNVPSFSANSDSTGAHTHASGDFSGSVGATGSGIDGDSEMTSGSATLPHLIMSYIIKT